MDETPVSEEPVPYGKPAHSLPGRHRSSRRYPLICRPSERIRRELIVGAAVSLLGSSALGNGPFN